MTSPGTDLMDLRLQILSRVRKEVPKVFKREALTKIKLENIEWAVDEALKGFSPLDLVLIKEADLQLCVKCGECCRINDPIAVRIEDLLNIAIFLGISLDMVIANYAKQLKNGAFSLKAKPCVFLQGNQCSIYPARPAVCVMFPLKAKNGHVTLGLYKYCQFGVNFIVKKAIGILCGHLMEQKNPELGRKMLEIEAQIKKRMPKDYADQLDFAKRLVADLKISTKGKEKRQPTQT